MEIVDTTRVRTPNEFFFEAGDVFAFFDGDSETSLLLHGRLAPDNIISTVFSVMIYFTAVDIKKKKKKYSNERECFFPRRFMRIRPVDEYIRIRVYACVCVCVIT